MSDQDELNLGSDWEQSKRLLIMWHERWSEAKFEIDVLKARLALPIDYSEQQRLREHRNKLRDRLKEIVKYCEPHKNFMWAQWITGLAFGGGDWRDL